ncbi:Hypothetical predicted protein [Olea europaea subsp. europaea]|uniref:Uncharacterized protein n=1 Tax=Olea europaea subsp. europaea TaxID=158383 RepID=A0A8S0PEA1_OLEEU|nr:Hypothetical predicted protein [Olea europaea subsp. europaea]
MRFGLQEYAAVTGLRCGVFPEGEDFDRFIERKRLKERYFKSNDKVWAFEAISEIGECFGQRVGQRLPRILCWPARKQPQHRTYDAFFKNLHVYVTLWPTDAEAEQSYLCPLSCRTTIPWCPFLMTLVRSGRSGDGETSGDYESDGESGSDREGDDSEDTGDFSTPAAAPVAPHPPTTATRSTGAIFEPGPSGCSPQDRAYSPPCTDEGELLVGTEDLPEGANIAPCPDAEHEPLPTPIDDQEGIASITNGATTEPLNAAAVSDAEIDGCNITDGEGIVATVPVLVADVLVPAPVPEEGGRVCMTRRRFARLRHPAPARRTPYTRGGKRH